MTTTLLGIHAETFCIELRQNHKINDFLNILIRAREKDAAAATKNYCGGNFLHSVIITVCMPTLRSEAQRAEQGPKQLDKVHY